ncbi:MAG TPA: ATP-dependent Clp protease proteolytic subunit [Drouetiella sp.]|jgi:ATP-dependent protease ClpP protease subunit
MKQEQEGSNVAFTPGSEVELVNGKFVFEWTGLMTGCQSKVAILEAFAKKNPNSSITVIFNSAGGGVDDCREAFNRILLIRLIYKVHFTFIIVRAQSCALWFVQCADVRIGLPHCALMYHCVKWCMDGPQSASDLGRAKHSIRRNQGEFTRILCSRAKKPKKAAKKLLEKISDGFDHIFSAEEAVKFGWLDFVFYPELGLQSGQIAEILVGRNLS